MRISRLATITAIATIYALSAVAQPTHAANTSQPPSKQPTNGVPPSVGNPQYGGGSAQKQQTNGLPADLGNQQYGGGAQKRQ
jgi:hypothetical protein